MKTHRVLCLVVLVAACGSAITTLKAVSQPPAKKDIPTLIEQLGSDSYAQREEASRLLGEMDEALPALRAATRLPQLPLERRRRAEALVARVRHKIAAQAHEKFMREWHSEAEIDLFIDHLLAWPEFADKRSRVFLTDWQRATVRWAERHAGRKVALPETERWKMPFAMENLVGKRADKWRARMRVEDNLSKELKEDCLLGDGLVVFGGRVTADDTFLIPTSLISNVGIHFERELRKGKRLLGMMRGIYIFCDGDLELGQFVNSVIIATGNVKSKFGEDKWTIVISNARQHLKQLRLFDTWRVGVRVSDAASGASVDEVQAGSALARAGLQKGDVILAVGKEPIQTAEAFRKVVRRKVAAVEEATLTVRRAGKELELLASF